MADDFVTSGVIFEARDFSTFERTIRQANGLIDDLNDNLSGLGRQFSGIEGDLDFSKASDSASRFSISAHRDLLSILSDVTILIHGIEDLGRFIGWLGEVTLGVSIEMESDFARVAKTVKGTAQITEDGFFQMTEQGEQLKESLLGLTFEIPKTFEELTKIAELGGQLGITDSAKNFEEAQDIVISFTDTIAKLTSTTELSSAEAATSLAQIANLYQGSITDLATTFEQMGNVVTRLGNESATTEDKILNITERIAAAGQISGLSIDEVFGLGAAITSLGLRAESGGTAASTALLNLNTALTGSGEVIADNTEEIGKLEDKLTPLIGKLRGLEQNAGMTGQALLDQRDAFLAAGGSAEAFGEQLGATQIRNLYTTAKQIEDLTAELTKLRSEQGQVVTTTDKMLKAFAQGAGMTVAEFQALAEADPAEAITRFVEGLALIDAEGGNVTAILDDIGLSSSEARRTFLGLAGAGGLLRESLKKANEEMDSGNALAEEAALRFGTLESHWTIFNNIVDATKDELFSGFLPVLGMVIDELGQTVLVVRDRLPGVFESLWSKIKEVTDGIGGIDTSIDFDLSENVTEFLDNLKTKIDAFDTQSLVDWINYIKDDFVPAVKENLNLAGDYIQGLVTKVENFTGIDSADIQNFIDTLGQAASERVQSLKDFTTGFGSFVTGIISYNDELRNSGAIQMGVALLDGILTPLQTLSEGLLGIDLRQELIDLVGGADTEIGQVLTNVETSVNNFVTWLSGLDISQQIADLFSGVNIPTLNIPEIPALTIPEITVPEITIPESVSNFFNELKPLAETTLPALGQSVDNLYQTLTGEAGQNIIKFVTDLATAIMKYPIEHATQIGATLRALTEISLSQLQYTIELLNGLVQVVGGLVGKDKELRDSGFLQLGEAIYGAFDRPINSTIDLLDDLTGRDLRTELFGQLEFSPELTQSLSSFAESLGKLLEALGRLSGIELGILGDDLGKMKDSLTGLSTIENLQKIVDFLTALVSVKVNQITAVVDGITSLLDLITGLRTKSEELQTAGSAGLGQALTDYIAADLKNFRLDFSLQEAVGQWFTGELSKSFTAVDTGIYNQQFLDTLKQIFSLSAFGEGTFAGEEDFNIVGTTIADGIKNAVSAALATGEFATPEDFAVVGQMLINNIRTSINDYLATLEEPIGQPIKEALAATLTGALTGLDWGEVNFEFIGTKTAEIVADIKERFTGILDDVKLGFPSVEDLTTVIDGIIAKIQARFQEIEIFGFKLFDTEQATDDATQAGETTSEGFAQGIRNKLDTAVDAAVESLGESPFSGLVEWLQSESPSQVYAGVGQDVLDGFVEGLSNTEPAQAAMRDSAMALVDVINQEVRPSTELWREENTLLAEEMNSEVIPTLELTTLAGGDLDSMLRQLYDSTTQLADALEDFLAPALTKVKDLFSQSKSKAKDLIDILKELIEQYGLLAEAIEKVNSAGTGTPASPTTPTTGSVPFAEGGSFTVPSNIPDALRGPTGGMLMEVHPNELVQILSANLAKSVTRLPTSLESYKQMIRSPQVSGVPISNVVNHNQQSNVTNEFNLNIRESPTNNIRDSYDLMRTLAGA